MGTRPVLKSRCTWLSIRTHARQGIEDSVRSRSKRVRKFSQSVLSLKMTQRSIPRRMIGEGHRAHRFGLYGAWRLRITLSDENQPLTIVPNIPC
jgi:hypothetical protein